MIDIIKNFIDIIMRFINTLFFLKVELINGKEIALGYVVVAFIFIVVALYLILNAAGVIKKGDDE